MLRLVKQACGTVCGMNTFGFRYLGKESQTAICCGVYLHKTDLLGKVAGKDEMVKSELLMRAAKVVEGMIKVRAGSLVEKGSCQTRLSDWI